MEFIIIFLNIVIAIVKWSILARVLMSWVQVNPYSVIPRLINETTEPVLRPIRRVLPRTGMIDLSPLIAFFALDLLQMGLINLFAGF